MVYKSSKAAWIFFEVFMKKHAYGRLISALIVALAAWGTASAQDKVPQWLAQAALIPTPTFEMKDVPAVQLLNEETVTIALDGTIVRTVRRAVRVLELSGREEAVARVIYQTDSDKVRSLDAWLVRKAGAAKEYGKKDTVDIALQSNDLYNEARVRVISAKDVSVVGDVFGFESILEEKKIFSQFGFAFQYDIPAVRSRFLLNIPSGWRTESVTFNAATVAPTVNGSSYAWEMRDLKPIRPEPQSPRWTSLAPRLSVSVFPNESSSTRLKTFSNWNEVARWMSEIEDPQMTVNDELAAKAKDLTVGAKTEFQKIQAISRYVQGIQYISIQVGTGRGGGYVPRSATDVFARSYGDCKDKANLMRAMLSILKIESFMVSITADDPNYVRTEWASPHQFNHCIIAVKISDQTTAASVVKHPALGRLLIFDPTDPYTPLGDLPEDEQGSLALIDHKDTHELIRMPVLPAEMNRVDRQIEAFLSPEGSISGTIVERTFGQAARSERARMKNLSSDEYKTMIDRWISRGASGATTSRIEPNDSHLDGKFDLQVDFSAARYAQIMQQRLMVFKPAIVGRLDRLSFGDGKRMSPYLIEASAYSERAKIKLPPGFLVDEMPEAIKIESEFGNYSVSYTVVGEHLVFDRSLKLDRSQVPPDRYESVKAFFGKVHAAEQSPVVLIRK